MTPTDELITLIISDLTKRDLVSGRAVGKLRKKLDAGTMIAQDWRDIADATHTDLADAT